jgi:hypothetical protein
MGNRLEELCHEIFNPPSLSSDHPPQATVKLKPFRIWNRIHEVIDKWRSTYGINYTACMLHADGVEEDDL